MCDVSGVFYWAWGKNKTSEYFSSHGWNCRCRRCHKAHSSAFQILTFWLRSFHRRTHCDATFKRQRNKTEDTQRTYHFCLLNECIFHFENFIRAWFYANLKLNDKSFAVRFTEIRRETKLRPKLRDLECSQSSNTRFSTKMSKKNPVSADL